jgi:hypothetical protein
MTCKEAFQNWHLQLQQFAEANPTVGDFASTEQTQWILYFEQGYTPIRAFCAFFKAPF